MGLVPVFVLEDDIICECPALARTRKNPLQNDTLGPSDLRNIPAYTFEGFKDAEAYRQSKTILLEMGQFFQVQDDFLDCFGNPEVTGKIGTDIQDNKCSWLAVVCMQRANDDQKAIMAECYGQNDAEKVERVKKLYEELGIPNTYAIYEEDSYNMIKTHIQQTSRGVPHEIFLQILNKIYQRDA